MGRMRREVNVIELTPEQRQAVDQGEPVRVVDPATEEAYVVVRAEVYERLAGQTRAEVYQRCLRRGLRRGEFYVTLIGEREAPPWVPTPLEESLFEVTDDEPPGAGSATP